MTTTELPITRQLAARTNKTSLGSAALIAGIGLLIMVLTAPFAELYVLPKLIISGDAAKTVENILANQTLFTAAIFGYLLTFICDVVVAWAIYVLLRPVNEYLSLLTAWFRLVYTVIAIVALLNLVTVIQLVSSPDRFALSQPAQWQAQVLLSLNLFRSHWYFGLLFFGIHLGLLGYLVFRSSYIPRILGVLLVITGAGYLLTSIRPYLFPDIRLDFAEYTFYGELIFMLWLLIKGPKIDQAM